jgi:hypothetical protein
MIGTDIEIRNVAVSRPIPRWMLSPGARGLINLLA